MTARKSTRGQPAVRDTRPARRDPRVELDEAPPRSTESLAPREMMARVRGLARDTDPPDLAAALEAEREARARDAGMLGELFVRACDADAKRRTAETAADALAQRVATLESELRELRARGGATEASVAREGEARARALDGRLHTTEDKLRRAEEALRTAEERARIAEQTGTRLETAARASKDESASLSQRVESLEAALRSARSDREDEQGRAADLARRVEELSARAARATEVETLKARAAELEQRLVAAKDEHARTAMKVTHAETRSEELAALVNEYDQRATRAELESEKARTDLDAARKRGNGIETELARVMKRVNELERDLTATRAEADAAELQLRSRTDGINAARALLAELEAEEQRTAERRRKAIVEAREVLSRGDGAMTSATRAVPPPVRIEAPKRK